MHTWHGFSSTESSCTGCHLKAGPPGTGDERSKHFAGNDAAGPRIFTSFPSEMLGLL